MRLGMLLSRAEFYRFSRATRIENVASRADISFDFDPLRCASSADDHAVALCCVGVVIVRARGRAVPTFLFAGSDAYCKRFQALLSILLTLLPAIPQLQYVSG